MAAVDVLPVAFFHHAIVTTMAGMALRLHHIVVDAHDLPALARFWAQALGWLILSEREQEVVIGPDETAPVGMCFMPVSSSIGTSAARPTGIAGTIIEWLFPRPRVGRGRRVCRR